MSEEQQELPITKRSGKRESRIPHFKTLEEEAEFWDAHSTTEFEDEFEPVTEVKFVVRRSPVTRALTVRVDEQTFRRLAEQASRQGIGPATLARMWILEHLRRADTSASR
jgi:hypothetical protein